MGLPEGMKLNLAFIQHIMGFLCEGKRAGTHKYAGTKEALATFSIAIPPNPLETSFLSNCVRIKYLTRPAAAESMTRLLGREPAFYGNGKRDRVT
jgi:hypothetical protein